MFRIDFMSTRKFPTSIIDVTNTFLDGLNTGIQTITRNLVRVWLSSGIDCELVVFNEERSGYISIPASLFLDDRISAKERWETIEHSELLTLMSARLIVLELPDSLERIEHIIGLRESEQANEIVTYVHDLIPLTVPRTTSGVGTFAKYTQLLACSTTLIANSQTTAEGLGCLFNLLGKPITKISVLPPTVPDCISQSTEPVTVFTSDRHRLRVPKHISVLMVGSLEPRKNHLFALLAVERLWKSNYAVRLTIAGCRTWGAEHSLRLVKELQTRGRPISVKICLSDAELADVYAKHDVVLFPSLAEGFGLPVAEAIAHGCIPVTSGVSAMAEFEADDGFQRQGGILIDPLSLDSIETGLKHAINIASRDLSAVRVPAFETIDWATYGTQIWESIISAPATYENGKL